jgi:heat shock protein HtpX
MIGLSIVAAVNLWVVLVLVVAPVVALYTGWAGDGVLRLVGIGAAIGVLGRLVLQVVWAASSTIRQLGAQEVEHRDWPRLVNLGEELAIATGTTRLRYAIVEDPVPNALTVGSGRRSAVIVVTTGLVNKLVRDEVEAVLAVQQCAIARLDVGLRTAVVACASGALAAPAFIAFNIADVWYPTIVRWLTMPSRLVARGVRRRAYGGEDFGADEMAVAITRHPDALRRALVKLLADPGVVQAVTDDNAPLWFEPMPSPHPDREAELARVSMTPSLEARIARLDQVPA